MGPQSAGRTARPIGNATVRLVPSTLASKGRQTASAARLAQASDVAASFASPARQFPIWPDVIAGVSVWDALQIILMFGFGFPEVARRNNFCDHLARPQMRSFDIGDRVFGDLSLLIAGVKNRRTVAGASIVALAIGSRTARETRALPQRISSL